MALVIDTNQKDIKSIKELFSKNGVFYSSLDLANKLKSYLPEDITEVYDPTCGSGALLSVFDDSVKKYGQELDPQQAEYAQSALVNAEIQAGNTLEEPAFLGKKFKGIVANPPFSVSWNQNEDERFTVAPALAPKSKADYAFILHCLHYLADDGKAVILDAHGVLFRGGAEGKIRQWLIDNNYIERIVSFDKGYFVDTSIPTCALILSKHKTTTDIFVEDTVCNLGRSVPLSEIKENEYNLNIPRYVQKEEPKIEYNFEEETRNAQEATKEILKADLKVQRMLAELEYKGNPLSNYKKYLQDLREIINNADNNA